MLDVLGDGRLADAEGGRLIGLIPSIPRLLVNSPASICLALSPLLC